MSASGDQKVELREEQSLDMCTYQESVLLPWQAISNVSGLQKNE